MDKFRMADIIPLLPIPSPPQGKSSYYVPCPHCDRRGRKNDKHLNINLQKDVFRCAMCGWNGGIFDLYAFYSGTPRDKVRDELIFRINGDPSASGKKQQGAKVSAPRYVEFIESPAVGIDIRNATYSSLLSMLPLAPDHKQNLLARGLSETAIIANGYGTTPMVGGKVIAKQLLDSGCQIEGVPGFYKDASGTWTFIKCMRGILIPVRDLHGRIQGIQVRRDNQEKRKYRWISSADIEGGSNGCGAEGWIHIAGPVRERVILIEGPLKADVVYHLTGQTVIAVPGVNSLKHLERVLIGLIELGVVHLMTAFDMDYLKNPHVKNGYTELVTLLGHLKIQFGTYLWQPEYNGLDDYVWDCCLKRM